MNDTKSCKSRMKKLDVKKLKTKLVSSAPGNGLVVLVVLVMMVMMVVLVVLVLVVLETTVEMWFGLLLLLALLRLPIH